MAQAKVKRRKLVETGRTEFPVPLEKVLTDLLDPQDVLETDKWLFVDAGPQGLIICRDRVVQTEFDDNGDPLPAAPVEAEPLAVRKNN